MSNNSDDIPDKAANVDSEELPDKASNGSDEAPDKAANSDGDDGKAPNSDGG